MALQEIGAANWQRAFRLARRRARRRNALAIVLYLMPLVVLTAVLLTR